MNLNENKLPDPTLMEITMNTKLTDPETIEQTMKPQCLVGYFSVGRFLLGRSVERIIAGGVCIHAVGVAAGASAGAAFAGAAAAGAGAAAGTGAGTGAGAAAARAAAAGSALSARCLLCGALLLRAGCGCPRGPCPTSGTAENKVPRGNCTLTKFLS